MAGGREIPAPQVGSRSYWINRSIVRFLVARFLRLTVEGREHIPRNGGLLIVSNHLSIADPPLLATISPRPVTFMGKRELFRNPILGRIFTSWGVFPVRRGEVDIGAVRMALGLLKSGAAIVLFPEGTRHREGLGEALPGVGYFAARSGCSVLPVGIVGTESIRNFLDIRFGPTVTVRFGEPFVVPKSSAGGGADLIMRHIAALLPKARRGRYDVTSLARDGASASASRGA